MEGIQNEIIEIRKDIELIKKVLMEDFELSDEAVSALREARNTPEDDYVEI